MQPTPRTGPNRTPADDIPAALTSPAGHLFLGIAGFVLHIAERHTLTGYDTDEVFGDALVAGLPIIDARCVPEGVQIGLSADAPDLEPLQRKAARYGAAGARLANLPDIQGSRGGERDYLRASEQRAGEYAGVVAKALATRGGHLWIGPYGSAFYYGDTIHSGLDPHAAKIAALAAGLAVIDTRPIDATAAYRLVCTSPQVAVNRDPDENPDGLGYAPLEQIAALYREAGAEVFNIASAGER